MSNYSPTLQLDDLGDRVRLGLSGFFTAEGATLQEAADELVWKLLTAAMAVRCDGLRGLCAVSRPDMAQVGFLWEIGEIAAAGGDIRERLFGPR